MYLDQSILQIISSSYLCHFDIYIPSICDIQKWLDEVSILFFFFKGIPKLNTNLTHILFYLSSCFHNDYVVHSFQYLIINLFQWNIKNYSLALSIINTWINKSLSITVTNIFPNILWNITDCKIMLSIFLLLTWKL